MSSGRLRRSGRPGFGPRQLVALGVTAALLVAFAAFGGASEGGRAIAHLASAPSNVVRRAFDPSAAGSSAPRFLAADCSFIQGGPDLFELGVSSPQTAGKPFVITITTVECDPGGLTFADTSYNGPKQVIFGGPGYSARRGAPVYPPTVDFRNGVGTATITLFDPTTSTTLRAYQGEISGSTSFAVDAG